MSDPTRQSAREDTAAGRPARAGAVLGDDSLIPRRFLVVSNRLPYKISVDDGQVRTERGLGGLVTALDPILHRTGGTWIGWSGKTRELPPQILVGQDEASGRSYQLNLVQLSRQEADQYYLGYSNRCLWPLFHYFQEYCRFDREEWESYEKVNRKFARAVLDEYREDDLIWVHDYHLMLVPAMIRQELPSARIAFFLHIPFPAEEVYQIAPQARRLLDGILGADLVGFHTPAYARNFLDAVKVLTDHRYERTTATVSVAGRPVRTGSFPISIDADHFEEVANRPETDALVKEIRAGYRAKYLAIGVDRLDYTKGIPERLHAIEIMLDRHPELQGKFTFIQVSAPSRTKVHAYRDMREKVERMVGRINGRFGARGCIPIDYRYEEHAQERLVAYYRAADLALVTPLRDGMNLVAKEYVASRSDLGGMLVLSRFAGAAGEMGGAIVANPYEPEAMAEGIYQALTMPEEKRRRRMKRMREHVRKNDIYWWLERYLHEVPHEAPEAGPAAGSESATA